MNRKVFFILLVAAFAVLVLGSCVTTNRKVVDIHNSKDSLDWDGVYTGTIPAASGTGINVRLKISEDQSFELSYEYIDKPNLPVKRTGLFRWDNSGEIITLNINDIPPHYKVGENKLIQLDLKGKMITGMLADNYVLKKEF